MTLAFIEFEDVLARSDKTPIVLGLSLLRCLRGGYKIALSSRETKLEHLNQWLQVNGFNKEAITYQFPRAVTEATMSDDDLFLTHLKMAMATGVVELVVTAAPVRAALAMSLSVTALLYASPATARPDFRPGHQLRGWADIEEEITSGQILKTKAMKATDD